MFGLGTGGACNLRGEDGCMGAGLDEVEGCVLSGRSRGTAILYNERC